MSEIAKRIDAIIKEGLAPLLKKEGFKKKARNFYREHKNRIELINIQASKWNEGNEGQFTVNVGVYYPDIAKVTDALPVNGIPKEYDCTIRERIGFLKPDKKDAWWKINSSSNDAEVSENVANQVKELCLPWLDKMSNLDEVKSYIAKNNRAFVAAGIALLQGNRDEASLYIEQALKQQPLAKSKINSWGRKHGLVQA
jgi:hypothetical protein